MFVGSIPTGSSTGVTVNVTIIKYNALQNEGCVID